MTRINIYLDNPSWQLADDENIMTIFCIAAVTIIIILILLYKWQFKRRKPKAPDIDYQHDILKKK